MEKMEQLDREYVESLEMELTKMLMFERELPLSIELVSRAIESCRLKLSSSSADAGAGGFQRHLYESSSSEETAGYCDRELQFIPIKKLSYESASESEEEKQQDLNQPCDKDGDADADKNIEKSVQRSDWLRSVQLWNQTTDLPTESEDLPEKETENVAKSAEKRSSPGQAESCSTETKDSEKSGARKKGDKEGTSQRKQRRCWSQDLHRSFLHSLQQLGGAHVATPKQIRDLMKVDGLTNDEVKSHLQKYRLHTRRPARLQEHNNDGNTQAPRFVIGGGIWAPPADSTTLAVNREANGAPKNGGLHTPMAAPAAQPHPWQEQFNQKPQNTAKNSQGHGDGLARCISPSMSSSTRTTASQVY